MQKNYLILLFLLEAKIISNFLCFSIFVSINIMVTFLLQFYCLNASIIQSLPLDGKNVKGKIQELWPYMSTVNNCELLLWLYLFPNSCSWKRPWNPVWKYYIKASKIHGRVFCPRHAFSFFIPPLGHDKDVAHCLYLFFEWQSMFFQKDLIRSVFEQDGRRSEELYKP